MIRFQCLKSESWGHIDVKKRASQGTTKNISSNLDSWIFSTIYSIWKLYAGTYKLNKRFRWYQEKLVYETVNMKAEFCN